MNKKTIFFYSLMLCITACNDEPGLDIPLDMFMYPKAGQMYEYTFTDGGKYQIYGENEIGPNSIEVLEEADLSIHDSFDSVKNKYTIYHNNKSIVRVDGNETNIILKRPLSLRSSWSRKGAIGEPTPNSNDLSLTLKPKHYRCSINKISDEKVFNLLRTVIRVQCILEQDEELKTILTEEYATGLGMITQSIETLTSEGKSMGIFNIRLIRIYNKGTANKISGLL